tara:strand:+ start:182305 stop:182946 length:642 start_codon:yes stop_codon:yes gene_type:complete
MSCLKFSLVAYFILSAGLAFSEEKVEKFTSKECLKSNFDTTVEREELWGLMKRVLTIKKDVCQISVLNKKKFFETSYKVDICREPIHMKVTVRGALDVYKRSGKCESKTQSEYCDFWHQLKSELEDQGLIFAKGEREKLSTPHGKVYCTYLVLNKYLGEGVLFSKYDEPENIYVDDVFKGEPRPSSKKPTPLTEKAPVSEKREAPAQTPQGRF